jgi:hypothetical protein
MFHNKPVTLDPGLGRGLSKFIGELNVQHFPQYKRDTMSGDGSHQIPFPGLGD